MKRRVSRVCVVNKRTRKTFKCFADTPAGRGRGRRWCARLNRLAAARRGIKRASDYKVVKRR